jgi:beta-aspartyl-dipeptidase (metallo-type)
VDGHVHILGGGGEGGPASRAPEITLESIVSNGVSTLVGCLGTDCSTRHIESLLSKANGLQAEGIDAYILTGGWGVPPMSITRSVQSDLVFIEKVVGAGEIAVSDHRSTQPTLDELAKLAAECRLGGLISGKAGVLHLHIGTGRQKLGMLHRLIEDKEIPPTQIVPTHINYTEDLLAESIRFIERGGRVDLNAFEDPLSEREALPIASAVRFYLDKGVSLDRVSISSDAMGTLAFYDENGEAANLTVASQRSLLNNFRYLLQNAVLDLETTIRLFATHPAKIYKLHQKGTLHLGHDADLLVLDDDYEITDMFVKGRRMIIDGEVVARGTFSPTSSQK